MKVKSFFITAILALVFLSCNQLEKEKKALKNFHVDKPDGWYNIHISDEEKLANLKLTDAQVDSILKNTSSGKVSIATYTKHDPTAEEGMTPTIGIVMQKNNTESFEEFKTISDATINEAKKMFKNVELIDAPQEVEIDGIKSVYFKIEFDLNLVNDSTLHVRSWQYTIPSGPYFYKINFSDLLEKDDCSAIFEKVLKSVRID